MGWCLVLALSLKPFEYMTTSQWQRCRKFDDMYLAHRQTFMLAAFMLSLTDKHSCLQLYCYPSQINIHACSFNVIPHRQSNSHACSFNVIPHRQTFMLAALMLSLYKSDFIVYLGNKPQIYLRNWQYQTWNNALILWYGSTAQWFSFMLMVSNPKDNHY